MKKLGVLLLAAVFAVFGLMTFAACNEETIDPGDDPIVTPEPDDPDDPDDPGKPEEPTTRTTPMTRENPRSPTTPTTRTILLRPTSRKRRKGWSLN